MALEKSQIKVITSGQLRKNDFKSPDLANTSVEDIYIHFDADVIDASVGHANRFASPGGLFPEEVEKFFSWVAGNFRIRALSIAAYNPDFDKNKNIERAVTDILLSTVEAVSNNGPAT
jgi:arginase family enzyme